jgi:Uma2 family endonuclease
MATTTILSEQEYRELALEEEDRSWELWDGVLVEKPWMSAQHNAVAFYLGVALANQLDDRVYRITVNGDRAQVSSRSFFIPDVMVIPVIYQASLDPNDLGAYADPLPLVVEVWSPTTGRYDIEAKLPAYRQRGDLEIWFIYHDEGAVTVWRKQPDGTYADTRYTAGIVPVASLPGVTIDLDALLSRWGRRQPGTSSQ